MTCNTPRPLAIVVVNYAAHRLLAVNLAGVARENTDAHIVVVDSFSSDAEQRAVATLARDLGWILVPTQENVGFGAGMNLGVAAAKQLGAEAFLLLNPDASIDGSSVRVLREALEEDADSLLAPMIYDGGGKVWFDGADLLLDSGRTQSVRRRATGVRVEPWLTGACLMVSWQLWAKVGGFDERYFLYWEDVDLSRRVRQADGALRVVPEAKAVHDEGGTQTVGKGRGRAKSNVYYYYNIRNRLLFAGLHLGPEDRARWVRGSFSAAYEVLMRGGRRQMLRPVGALTAAVRGSWDGLALLRAHGRTKPPS